ncbi:MAG TPA: aminopeptidase [Candidatus Binatia bacterium]
MLLARVAVLLGALSCLVGCGGCSPLYVLRSAYEEGRILLSRQSIESLLEKPELDPDTRAKLELVLEVRRFARDRLGLAVGDAYASFSIVPPGALLHVVSAAERTRLEPYTWWFPIVGDVDYKGFFDEADARAEAERLQSKGYDTWVRPSVAFSTLGWFDDPVLSSWLRADPVRITELLIHELLHRTWYVSGETEFNESLATFVGHVGAIEFFRARDGEDAETTRRAVAGWDEALAESRLWTTAVEELRALYEASAREGRPVDEVLAAREKIFRAIERGELDGADAFPAAATQPTPRRRTPIPVNNAVILANYAYLKELDAFDAIYRQAGDLRASLARLREIVDDADDPFAALAQAASTAPPPSSHVDTAPPSQSGDATSSPADEATLPGAASRS